MSAHPNYKRRMNAICHFLDGVDETYEDHEGYVTGLIMKNSPLDFFCKLKGHFKSNCTQFWGSVADEKPTRLEQTGANSNRGREMNDPGKERSIAGLKQKEWAKSDLENAKLREKLNTMQKTAKIEK